jgi:hypothetical protein
LPTNTKLDYLAFQSYDYDYMSVSDDDHQIKYRSTYLLIANYTCEWLTKIEAEGGETKLRWDCITYQWRRSYDKI